MGCPLVFTGTALLNYLKQYTCTHQLQLLFEHLRNERFLFNSSRNIQINSKRETFWTGWFIYKCNANERECCCCVYCCCCWGGAFLIKFVYHLLIFLVFNPVPDFFIWVFIVCVFSLFYFFLYIIFWGICFWHKPPFIKNAERRQIYYNPLKKYSIAMTPSNKRTSKFKFY